ncbi:bifunctional acetate--CoA ligase family protein/GNAT family N-acetyltransferase [Neisseria polysaccharea]|uniref:bifunctional acetate--CoA ligase family protein/GNAT family N-acetyltransferase n=1 Tax=Neisseria polysaccharea TaxID=489 RepID=UPI002729DFE6|nr:bifunctional acetate--CoA ligase family protein/GNAT family N-acetyltransferase [Neisseria polysaccharea]
MSAQTDPGYFFMPNHIILIGASEQPYSLGERVLSNLLSTPFQGKITPVNPRHHTIAGLPAYTSLNKIPGSADLIIAVTPPDSYDTLLKTCRKKQLRHIILIQDWDSLSAAELHTAETAIRKHHGDHLNITACTTAGIQIPSLGLNISTHDEYAAGYTAILTGDAAVSRQIDTILKKLHQGISRHISLNYGISPITSSDWLNRFGHSLHTKTAVLHHNPEEDQRKLFSAIRQFTRHTPLILHITYRTTETDRAVLHSLARHCNFLISFNADDLEAALRAQLSDLPPLSRLDILSDTPAEWLHAHAPKNLTLHFPNLPHHIHNGHLTGTPTPSICHDIASRQLAHPDTQAVLTILSPSGHEDYKKTARALIRLSEQTAKPLLVSSPFSDDITHFGTPTQAIRTLSYRNTAAALKQAQLDIAPPQPCRLKTPQPQNIKKALAAANPSLLAEALHLPPYRHTTHNAVQFQFGSHPLYGDILTARCNGQTTAVLPPFTTLDSRHLARFAELDGTQTLDQFLHTLTVIPEYRQHILGITLNLNGGQYSSDFILKTPETHDTPKRKNTGKAAQTLEHAAAKMQSAAQYLKHKNPAASEFLRHTSEAAAELLGSKTATDKKTPNVLPPYPEAHPKILFLKNNMTVTVSPLLPEDTEAKQKFIRKLSPEARYTRFMTHTNELPEGTLARLCNSDYYCEAAWTARDNNDNIVAVARHSRLNRNECEFAIALAEHMRGSGLAQKMMGLVIRTAAQQGYRAISADILKTNTPMIKLAEKSGFTLKESDTEKNLYRAYLNLAADKTTEKTNKNLHTNHKIP